MRWILVILLAYVALLLQISLVNLITVNTASVGTIKPDLALTVALFFALYGRTLPDVMIAAWILGLGLDLTHTGGAGTTTAVGPMAVAYALSAALVYQIREAFFREWVLTHMLLGLLMCLTAHMIWISWQSVRASDTMSWPAYGELVIEALLLSVYTALLAPVVHFALSPLRRLAIPASVGRSGRQSRA